MSSLPEPCRKEGPIGFEELIRRGVFLFYRQREREALECLRSALKAQPRDLRARYLISLAALSQSDEATIEQMTRSARQLAPQNAYTLACSAVWFTYYSNYSRADQFFEQALLQIPNDVHLWFGRGMAYDLAGEREKAIGAYLHVVTLDPDNVSGHLSLGSAYAETGEFETAYEHYVRARELSTDVENPHSRFGRDLLFAGMVNEASAEFQQAIAEEPDSPAAYFYLLLCYRSAGKSDEALAIYQEIRQRFQNRPEETASYFVQFGMPKEAIRDYTRALAAQPDAIPLRILLANCYCDAGQWDAAACEYRKVIGVEPANRDVWVALGEALFRLGRYRQSIAALRRALELDPDDPAGYSTLADALILEGKTKLASDVLERQERLQQQALLNYQAKYFAISE